MYRVANEYTDASTDQYADAVADEYADTGADPGAGCYADADTGTNPDADPAARAIVDYDWDNDMDDLVATNRAGLPKR